MFALQTSTFVTAAKNTNILNNAALVGLHNPALPEEVHDMVLKIHFGQIVIFMTDLEEIIFKTCKLNPCDVKFLQIFVSWHWCSNTAYIILTF